MRMKSFIILFIFVSLACSCSSKKEPIGFGGLIEVVKKQELRTVEYRYHDMIFLHKKDNAKKKLRMIVKYPVTVEAYTDLSTISVDQNDKKIELDYPQLSPVVIDFSSSEIVRVRDGGLSVFGGSRTKLLEILKSRIGESQKRVADNAVKLGILENAKEDTEKFILSFLEMTGNLDYKVTFRPNNVSDTGVAFMDETTLNSIEIVDESIFSDER